MQRKYYYLSRGAIDTPSSSHRGVERVSFQWAIIVCFGGTDYGTNDDRISLASRHNLIFGPSIWHTAGSAFIWCLCIGTAWSSDLQQQLFNPGNCECIIQ